MEKIKKLLSVLLMKVNDEEIRQCNKNVAMSVIVCIASGIMLVMNIMKHSTLMTITSMIMIVGFILSGVLAAVYKKNKASSLIMAFILTGVFTVFPISGGNEGFAVLWLLLIPLFSIILLGMKIGLTMNLYFTLLILVLFYSPLKVHIVDFYTDDFMERFPILFMADFITAQLLAMSMEYYYRVTRMQIYTDDMTGAYNRKYFIEKLDDPEVLKDDLCISVIDVNGLKATNDTLGHAAGDEMICSVPIFARKAFGEDVIISRTGGDEFAILTFGSPEEIASKVEVMKEYASKYKGKFIGAVYLSVGIACRCEYKDLPTEGLFQTADKFMYVDKSAFYRQKDHDRRRR